MPFRTFSPQLENNDTSKCSTDSLDTPEICGQCGKLSELHWNVSCLPIAGRRSQIELEFGGFRISECNKKIFYSADFLEATLKTCPLLTCSNPLSKKKKKYLTLYMWHMTRDLWHVTCDTLREVNIFFFFRSLAHTIFELIVSWRFGGKGWVS